MPLPRVAWPAPASTVAPVSELSATASGAEERNASVLAGGGAIPVIYGRTTVGARVATVIAHGDALLLLCVIGRGEIDAVESATMDGEALPSGVEMHAYTGTAGQTPDAWLVAAFAAQGKTYADALPGIAYAVMRVPQAASAGFPQFVFTVRGRKLHDPRTGLTGYSDNPALALADFLTNTAFGCGMGVETAGIVACADRCDELVGGEKRRTLGLALTRQEKSGAWINTLRTYAGCFVDRAGSLARLIPDAPAAVAMSFDAGSIVEGSLKLRKRGTANTPTVMRVTWSDPAKAFEDAEAEVALSGVGAGTLDRLESSVPLPGVTRYSQAMREATERMNKLWLTDLEAGFEVFDEGLRLLPGAVIAVTHPAGLAAKQFRVTKVSDKGFGRWEIAGSEYDAAVYSDAVSTLPSTPDTDLPSPLDPPAVSGLALSEEVYQTQTGIYASRISAGWTAAGWPLLSGYRVELYDGATLLASETVAANLWRSGPLQEGRTYTVRVQSLSQFAGGAWASASLLAQGKLLPPGNVAVVTGFEAGGTVRLAWPAALDIDIWRYELRYVPVGGTWTAGKLIDRTDALRLSTAAVPAGTWDFMVKAIDSVGNYSVTEARCSIEVSLDAGAFLVDEVDFSAPVLVGMAEFRLGRLGVRQFITEDGASFSSKFTNALSTYTNPLATYHAPITQTLTTEAHDFGLSLSGNWQAAISSSALAGSVAEEIQLSPDASTWQSTGGLVAKATGRFARLRTGAASASDTVLVSIPDMGLRVDATPRVEDGVATSLVSGGKTVTVGNYAAAKSISITPMGTHPRSFSVDNILVGSPTTFEVYLFDTTGAQVADDFQYEFRGV